MRALDHVIIMLAGMLALFIFGVLIDLDHSGSWKCKWLNVFKTQECGLERGFMHNPLVVYSIFMFLLCGAIALIIHMMADKIV
jgi:hypothetical protein